MHASTQKAAGSTAEMDDRSRTKSMHHKSCNITEERGDLLGSTVVVYSTGKIIINWVTSF
jgi:hypothetical protein